MNTDGKPSLDALFAPRDGLPTSTDPVRRRHFSSQLSAFKLFDAAVRRSLTWVLLVAALASAARAAEHEVSVSVDYTSAYTFRGAKFADDSLQSALNLSFGSFYGTIWGNRPLGSEPSSELDFTAGWTASFGLDAGLTAYSYHGTSQTTWEPYVGYSRDFSKTTASVYAYHDLTLSSSTIEGKLSRPLFTFKNVAFELDAAIGHSWDSDLSYTYWSIGSRAKVEITKGLSASVGVLYTSSDDKEIERDIWSAQVGLSYTF